MITGNCPFCRGSERVHETDCPIVVGGELRDEQAEKFLEYVKDKEKLASCIFITCLKCGYTRRAGRRREWFHLCWVRRIVKKIFSRRGSGASVHFPEGRATEHFPGPKSGKISREQRAGAKGTGEDRPGE